MWLTNKEMQAMNLIFQYSDTTKSYSMVLILLFAVFLRADDVVGQQPTVGLIEFNQEGQQGGYVLFAPLFSSTTYLIDKCGRQAHTWKSNYNPGFTAYVLNDGSLLRCGVDGNVVLNAPGGGGIIEKISWDNTIEWSYIISDSMVRQHHEVIPMPNGNVLALVWELKTKNQALALGRNPAKLEEVLWSEKIVEIKPTGLNSGTIVWEWKLWDHLVQNFDNAKVNFGNISEYPELIDVNYVNKTNPKESDWVHANAVVYNPVLDQIMISSHSFNEIWIIDHSTTTEQAATHSGGKSGRGGDILYRWGNPEAYGRGTAADRKFFGQHNSHWIAPGLADEGKIMIFNNGLGRMGSMYSSIDIITPPVDNNGNYQISGNNSYSPIMAEWTYIDTIPMNLFSPNQSGAQRLPNGNTLICASAMGTFFEITPNKKTVWKYISPVSLTSITKQGQKPSGNGAFRAELYPENYPGFVERNITATNPIELDPYPSECMVLSVNAEIEKDVMVYPNPADDLLRVQFDNDGTEPIEISLISSFGKVINMQAVSYHNGSCNVDVSNIPSGMYALKILSRSSVSVHKIIIMR